MAVTRDLWLVLRARDEASRIVRSFGNNMGGAVGQVNANMTQFDQTMRTATERLNQFAQVSMLSGAVLTGMGLAGLAFIRSATQVAAEYDRQVRHTLTQVDDMTISLEQLAQVGRNVAREVEIPFEQLQETLFFIFSSMNVTIEESEELLKGFAKEAVAGQSTIEAAARTTISIMNALGLTVKDLGRIQDVQFQIVRKGIITYEELAAVIGRALPATARSGQSFETLGAMMAFLTRNGLSAAMAATSAARAMESFAHPVTVKRLEDMGIKVRDAAGEFLPLVTVMGKMNEKLKEMSQPERSAFLQNLFKGAGGTIQARRFWDVAFNNFDQFEEMIGHMANSSGVFENAYATMSDSVAAKSELIRNKWMLIQEALGRAVMPELLKLMTLFDKLLGWFDSLSPGVKDMVGKFILWGSVMAVLVGVVILFVGALAFMVSGVMAAGVALLYVLGALAAVTAAVVGISAAFIVAWQRSEGFRNAVKELGDLLNEVWVHVKDLALALAKAYDDKLRPSLVRLGEIIESRVLPAVVKFLKMWKEEVLPKVEEAKRIIIDLGKEAFEYISDIINTVFIPAIEKVVSWWDKNGESIKPFLSIAGQVVKWLLIIGAVILALPFLFIVSAIAAVILTVKAFIDLLKKMRDVAVTVGNAIIDFFVGLWEGIKDIGKSIKDFFADVWTAIVEGVKSGITFIGEAIKTALDFLYATVWMPFWNTFGGLIKAVFGFIMDTITFFTVLIGEIIKDWITPIVEFSRNKWMEIVGHLQEVWNFIVDLFKNKSSEAANFIFEKVTAIRNKIIDVFIGIKNFLAEVLNNIYNVIISMMNKSKEFWNNNIQGFLDAVVDRFNSIVKFVKDSVLALQALFNNARTWLIDAGRNMIQGLIDGVTEKIESLRKKLKELTEAIPDMKGPRAVDIKLLYPVGQIIMKGFMDGIADQLPMLARQLGGITTQIGQIPAPSFAMAPSFGSSAPIERTTTQYITINTQEIDPRIHATELGWELDGRL